MWGHILWRSGEVISIKENH